MRKPRKLKNHASYHVTARINRQEVIFCSKELKDVMLKVIQKAKRKYDFVIKNFCIMGNHIHLIIKPIKKSNLSKIMQWILSVFAMIYNKKFDLHGHVWYDRFKSKIIVSFRQYLATFIYVVKNPVVAGLVKCATDYEHGGVFFIQTGFPSIIDRPPTRIIELVWQRIVI